MTIPGEEPPAARHHTAGLDSWALVEAAKGGNGDAFAELWRRYHEPIRAYIARRVWNPHDVEQLTSEVFLRAWRRIGTVSNQGHDVLAWLNTITRNLVIDHAQSGHVRYSRPSRFTDDDGDEVAAAWLAPAPGADEIVIERENKRGVAARLTAMIDRLPANHADVIRCRFTYGMTIAEAASWRDTTDMAIKAAQHRGMTELRRTTPCTTVREFVDSAPDVRPGRGAA